MNCNCFNQSFQHKVTSLVQGTTSVEMTITNATNISDLDPFELLLCVNPDTVVTGDPLPFTLTINGTAGIALKNRWGLPIFSNRLKPRKIYRGRYVIDTSGTTPETYVILTDTPCCTAYARG